jgi:O-acetylhomoserine/O-acetylserine sulfhydrylase-like pyridoxal-dependent enzyme
MDRRELGAGTRVVRAARSLPPGDGQPLVPPLVQSVALDYGSAAAQDAVFGGERPGYVYGRYGTPTTAALESAMALSLNTSPSPRDYAASRMPSSA